MIIQIFCLLRLIFLNKLNVKKDKDNDEEYKDENSEAQKSDEGLINKTEEEEALIGYLMSMNFPVKVNSYVIGNTNSSKRTMIVFGKKIENNQI